MSKQINEPEKGNLPGVYEIEDVNGETRQLVAENFPQADAFVRMQARFVKPIAEYKAEQLVKLKADTEAKEKSEAKESVEKSTDKKG